MKKICEKKAIELRIKMIRQKVTDLDVAKATGYTREYVNKVRNGMMHLTDRNVKIIKYIKNLESKTILSLIENPTCSAAQYPTRIITGTLSVSPHLKAVIILS